MLLPHINYGMPILHFGGARRSGGCRYCHTALWKRAMRRLAHGQTRSRGVTRGLAHYVTWHCVCLHPIRLNRAFRSDLMWWRTFVEDSNGISFPPISPSCRWLQTHRGHGAVVLGTVATGFSSSGMRDQQISPSWSKYIPW